MAWTNPSDRLTGDVITAAQWNALLGTTGSLAQTDAAKVTTAGDIVYATAANTLARLGIGTASQVLTVSGGIPAWGAGATQDVALAGSSSAATSTTSTSAVDLVTISGLSIAVTQGWQLSFNCRKTATNANTVTYGLKVNSTVVYEADFGGNFGTSSTNSAQEGMAVFECTPRSSANYLAGLIGYFVFRTSSTGKIASGPAFMTDATTSAAVPNATITSIAVRATNLTNNNNAEITSVRILTGIV